MGFLSDLVGGIIGNETADKQADAIVDAQKRASQTTMDMFNRSNQIQAPNIQAGWNALGMQGSLLGMPNLVPQGAVDQALMATGGGADVWGQYLQANPDVAQVANQALQTPHIRNLGITTPQQFAEYHYNTQGRTEGRQLPSASGASGGQPGNAFGSAPPGVVSVGGGAYMQGGDGQAPQIAPAGGGSGGPIGSGTSVDNAYNTFLGSGFNRAMTDFTNNDLDQIKGNYSAGGKSLSGSAVGAMGDRLARNRYNAFGDYYNALSGISGTGANLGSQQASQANQVGSQLAQGQRSIGDARSSSYGVRGANTAGVINSGIDTAARMFGGF